MEINIAILGELSGEVSAFSKQMFHISKLIIKNRYKQIGFRKQHERIKLQQEQIEEAHKEMSDKIIKMIKLIATIGGK